ncbi:zinc ribbon domain-containing protein [Sinosporangium siamense]|uniref:Uncharacterized protein n=1 Tax=Sinosporangium siamense TaxID=1367973 RepID=A0A919V923_9ACTN|nr:zinc ribbon domain-containing protein [Sinosporangium siamense]GII96735.1 hypothetical protein Ssi02_69660 [Sinosporangium siamense]
MNESAVDILLSPLLALDEIGSLAEIHITYEVKQNGRSHSPSCRQRGKRTNSPMTTSVREFRAQGHHEQACRTCGGGDLPVLTPDQETSVRQLATLLPEREKAARREREAQRAAAVRLQVAEVIDRRAHEVLRGWASRLADERRRIQGQPVQVLTATTACSQEGECVAEAELSINTQTLEMRFRCPDHPGHGRYELGGEPKEVWMFSAPAKYDALALIVAVIAEDAGVWNEVYATRAHDYRVTVAALQAFDEANPQPLDLGLKVTCGLCERRMSFHDEELNSRLPPTYYCDHKHDDGRYHHVSKEDVDDAIDRHLRSRLRGRRHWLMAPELSPAPELVAAYADHLKAKIKTYDDHIGAAKADRFLAHERARIATRLEEVRRIQEHGVFVVAGLDTFADGHWRSTPASDRATELGRALLVDRVVCGRSNIRIVTHFDDHTALYRRLRSEELQREIATARVHLSELEEELAELSGPLA